MGAAICGADGGQEEDAAERSRTSSHRGAQLICETPSHTIAAAMGKEIDILDGNSGKRSRQCLGHAGPVTCLLSHQNVLYSGSIDKTVRRWDARRSTLLNTLEGHTGAVWCLAAAERSVFSASEDTTIRRWDARTGDALNVLEGHKMSVNCLVAMGTNVYSGSEDRQLRVWSAKTGTVLISHQHTSPVTCISVVDNSVFVGGKDPNIKRWSVETGQLQATLSGGHLPRRRVQVYGMPVVPQSADEELSILCLYSTPGYLFSGCKDGSIGKWDLSRNELVMKLGGLDEHELGVTCFLSQADLLLSGSADGTVRLWELDTGDLCNILEGICGVTCLVLTSQDAIYGGQARGTPQRLPPLVKRRWWKKQEPGEVDDVAAEGQPSANANATDAAARKFL